jgi:hypothetical protein
MCDVLAPDGVEPCKWVERREVQESSSSEEVREHVGHPSDVVRRNGDEGSLVHAGAGELNRSEQVCHQVPVSEQSRLRLGGGSAGEQHDRYVVVAEGRIEWARILIGDPSEPVVESDCRAVQSCGRGRVGKNESAGLARDQRVELSVLESVVDRFERNAGARR